ncbi:hypothetical protein [Flavilitoribacter nigricans]|uniref:Uncharacterized protein n=1 Tax=Flavilitoribacter nigricans (strain ATCC 23147 / DSM 23189 / NBRC 102662 / NCIMB 1420 / SS-2) TaxID=1122177 RepID=A0A2D0N8K8_FLAN2|nr:hypothetical protein [Flavilitoribacter nigricans]PHN04815.1 hypothetical protein CRP01_20100 [Flavilitoribacter nigricans DSM 23189 = NBRC 102662]
MKKLNLVNKAILLLLIVCLFGSCAKSILYWNQAIKSFEQGAEMEIKSQFADRLGVQGDLPLDALPNLDALVPATTAEVPVGTSPEEYYRMADEKITMALANPAPLVKEEKMGNALTIKALTAWKTGQLDLARTNAGAALEALAGVGQESPRDAALAEAIPGLVALDIAYDSTKATIAQLKERSDTAPDAERSANEAFMQKSSDLYRKFVSDTESEQSIAAGRAFIEGAIDSSGEHEDVKMYLVLSELTGLKNRFDFWAQLNNFAKRSRLKSGDEDLKNWLDEEEEDYINEKDAALARLKTLLGGDERHAVYRFWDGIL